MLLVHEVDRMGLEPICYNKRNSIYPDHLL